MMLRRPLFCGSLVLFMIVLACAEHPSAPRVLAGDAVLAPGQQQQGLIIKPAGSTIYVGQSLNLTVTTSKGNAVTKRATWTSSDTSIATVVSTGVSTATVTGRRNGTVTITATSGNTKGSTSLTVVPVPVRSVTLTPDSARVEAGITVQYTATPRDSVGNPLSGRTVTWSVIDAAIASISASGLATTLARGATRVIATVEGVADTTWLIVDQTPARIELAERSIIFDALGETKQLVANVYDRGNNLIADAVVTWGSEDAQIATVNGNGAVTPRTNDQSAWTFVHASIGALADTATVTVYRWPTEVIASPDTMFISELTPEGQTSGKFTAVMNDRNGFAINGGWLLWEVLDPGVVTASMEGDVVALANGTARVVAHSFSGVTDTVHVVVNAPPGAEAPRVVSALVPSNRRSLRPTLYKTFWNDTCVSRFARRPSGSRTCG